MESLELTEQLQERSNRRAVLKTGVKLAYAVPLVAASFKLTADRALAAVCLQGYQPVVISIGPACCRCRVLSGQLVVDGNGVALCVNATVPPVAAECIGLIQSIP
jgi:hypothetical protein